MRTGDLQPEDREALLLLDVGDCLIVDHAMPGHISRATLKRLRERGLVRLYGTPELTAAGTYVVMRERVQRAKAAP